MKEIVYDIYDYLDENEVSGLFVPTNGYVKKDGTAVCGVGILKNLANSLKYFPYVLGQKIKEKGNTVQHIINMDFGKGVVPIYSFPVKPKSVICDGTNTISTRYKVGSSVPGWASKCDRKMIYASVRNMIDLLESDKEYILYDPSCESSYHDFKSLLESLPDNVTVIRET